MGQLPGSIIITIALLTIFLVTITALKYAVADNFTRMRLIMTAFFVFIVATLTTCFYQFFFDTLPFTVPAGLAGMLLGYVLGVRAAEKRITTEGLTHYIEHFAHVDIKNPEDFNWWSIINFYSIMSALLLINLVGLTTVILHNLKPMALLTSAVGAFLIGTIVPYLAHLWSIKMRQNKSKSISE